MIDVTFTINGHDYAPLLSKFRVRIAYETPKSVTTLDGTEKVAERKRAVIVFSLLPLTVAQSNDLFDDIANSSIAVTYTNQYYGQTMAAYFRVADGLESAFALKSVDGNRYYKGGEITLRQITVL